MKNNRIVIIAKTVITALLILLIYHIGSSNFIRAQINKEDEKMQIDPIKETSPKIQAEEEKLIDSDHFHYEDLKFVDVNGFEIIKKAYEDIDFNGEFEKGNIEDYDYYIQLFRRLVDGKVAFIYKESNQEFYLKDFDEIKHNFNNDSYYNPNKYTYYFFDMDKDGQPELGISDESRFVYFFKYDTQIQKFTLWYASPTSWNYLIGSEKIGYGRGTSYAIDILNQNGKLKTSTWFYIDEYYNKTKQQPENVYIVSLPFFISGSENTKNYKSMRSQIGYYSDMYVNRNMERFYFFKITEDQWKQLTNKFFELREQSRKNINEVTYTYEELFGK